ncbi:MAG: hypothetical protein LBV17_08560 [Treponema sp.]|jgi:hypothetical protein|nr:hypothetical protein [Treponema sp.]
MTEIEKIFRPDTNIFTVFIVEQRFVVGRGHGYFNTFINTPNFFDSEEKAKKLFRNIIEKIEKVTAPVSKLISFFYSTPYLSPVSEIVTSLCKLFTVTEHQAAGPDVIDPIILQEGKVTNKSLANIVHLHKDSILRPSIIILLKDNDFERAKKLLSECPDGIYVKMIRNSGEEQIHKVINCGANDVNSFINSYAEQCYSTCSKTKREILLNSNWSENSIISKYSPVLFRYRSKLLFDQKEEIMSDLSETIENISLHRTVSDKDESILRSIECIAKLYRIFCNDYGGKDIIEAEKLARSLNNEVLLAQVYRYAELIPNCSANTRNELYEKGYQVFKKNDMEDHAIYCINNKLVEQFYTDHVYPEEFKDLQIEAVNNVPGMVGLSHIYNNVGIAYLYCGQATEAVNFFNHGLDYAKNHDRIVQKLALESNKMIAESYSYNTVEEKRIRSLMRQIFDSMGIKKLPFLTADYVLNILAVAYQQDLRLGYELIKTHPISELVNESFRRNLMCASERILQMQYLASHYNDSFPLLEVCNIPKITNIASGKRRDFILQYGYNPFDFNTWL